MKKLLICGATLLALSSCKSGWSSAEKEAFMTNCTSSASASVGATKAKDYCSCMEEKVEKKYPKAVDAGKLTANEITELSKDCAK